MHAGRNNCRPIPLPYSTRTPAEAIVDILYCSTHKSYTRSTSIDVETDQASPNSNDQVKNEKNGNTRDQETEENMDAEKTHQTGNENGLYEPKDAETDMDADTSVREEADWPSRHSDRNTLERNHPVEGTPAGGDIRGLGIGGLM